MNESLRYLGYGTDRISNRHMIEALRRALEKNYSRILQAAGTEWERRFAGKDPSDACVTIRIAPGDRTLTDRSTQLRPALPGFTAQAA